jgi:hypothetical protein
MAMEARPTTSLSSAASDCANPPALPNRMSAPSICSPATSGQTAISSWSAGSSGQAEVASMFRDLDRRWLASAR